MVGPYVGLGAWLGGDLTGPEKVREDFPKKVWFKLSQESNGHD